MASFAYALIHSGFNDSAYAYCDRCGVTAILSGWSADIPAQAGLQLHERITPSVEPFLAPCSCGGRFSASASPRCPTCDEPLDANTAGQFIEADALGAAQGWRWQRSWDGLYAIIINGREVQDPWLRHPSSSVRET
jgi:hypothetical protein